MDEVQYTEILFSGKSLFFVTLKGLVLVIISILALDLGVRTASASLGSWTSGENMPSERLEVASAALGDEIYIIGGSDRRGTSDKVEAYNTATNEWRTLEPLPEKRDHSAAAAYEGKIYVVGGFDNHGVAVDSLFVFDPVNNRWEYKANMPTARGALVAEFVNGTLYAIGGDSTVLYTSDKQYDPEGVVAVNEAYDPKTETWTKKSPMPTARDHLASAVVDGKIYAIGGRQPEEPPLFRDLDVNEAYDPSHDRWLLLEALPSSRSGLGADVVDGNVYVIGGESTERTFSNNEKYNPKTDIWEIQRPMPTPRHGMALTTVDDKVYAIGGGPEPGGLGSDTNEIYEID
jgi:N-acetylneuraminic acid mutarotase